MKSTSLYFKHLRLGKKQAVYQISVLILSYPLRLDLTCGHFTHVCWVFSVWHISLSVYEA